VHAILRDIVNIRNISVIGNCIRGEQNTDFQVRLSELLI